MIRGKRQENGKGFCDEFEHMKKIIMYGKETQYMVSEDGKVYDSNGNEVKPSVYHGYVTVYIPDFQRCISVARIVATMFIKKDNPDYTIVIHKDNNPLNNTVSNLAWMSDGHWDKRNLPKGEMHHYTKHTNEQARQVCELLMNPNNTFQYIADTVKCSLDFVMDIYYKEGWKHIACSYNFPKRTRHIRPGYIVKILRADGTDSGYTVSRSGYVRGLNGKRLKRFINMDGYYCVRIDTSAGLKYYGDVPVHNLVADAFVSYPDNIKCQYRIIHIDGNKLNNNYKNLKWEITS